MIRSRSARFVKDEFLPTIPALQTTDCCRSCLGWMTRSSLLQVQHLTTPITHYVPLARKVIVKPPLPRVFDQARALSPLPYLEPEVNLPADESSDEPDFLGNDPFDFTLANVEVLYSAVGKEPPASHVQSALPTSYPNHHHEAMRDCNAKRWRFGKQNIVSFSPSDTTFPCCQVQ